MLSGKVEKRIASSVYITLAPPKRDMVSKVDTRPEVHQQRSDPPTEATKSVRTQQPQVSPPRKTPTSSHQAGQASSSAGPSCGATGSSSAGFSTFPCPVLPDIPTGSDLESPLPSPPDPLLSSGLDALSAETLCPDLQTLNLSSPVNQQASSSTPEELRQHKIQATNLEQADERQVLKRNMNGHLERDISTGTQKSKSAKPESPNRTGTVQFGRCRWQRGNAGTGWPSCTRFPMCPRKYASVCGACETPIVPQGGQDAYRIECLGRHFHETCYRCETCGVLLSPEPAENGCYPLESRIFCKSCHIKQKNESFC
nr:filamin-binding LIM protein 1 [Pelodiscus sinensis]|eukprot:XP_025035752.1 filamin-binding LIM protein 1 [Pelodiscus sinensis]